MASDIRFTIHDPLEPIVVRTIREAFEDALLAVAERRGPKAPPPSDETRARIAREIVSLAKQGVCDFGHLRDGALNALHIAL